MDARPAEMRQWRDRKAISQSAPHYVRKQGGDCHLHRTNARERQSERTEWTGKAASSSEEPEATRRPDRCSHTREREDPDQTRVKTPRKGQEQSQTELNHGENWKTQPSREPPKVSSRKGATGSDSKPTDPEEEEKPTPQQRQRRSD